MKPDLATRSSIEQMVNLFYDQVKTDAVIGFFFSEVIPVNWGQHLPKMYDFWESVILGHATYTGNPLLVHQQLNEKSPLKKEHFNRWIEIFMDNLNANFEGPYTEIARQRALSITTVMELKIK